MNNIKYLTSWKYLSAPKIIQYDRIILDSTATGNKRDMDAIYYCYLYYERYIR